MFFSLRYLLIKEIIILNERHEERETSRWPGRKSKRLRRLKMESRGRMSLCDNVDGGKKACSCEVNRENCVCHQVWMGAAGWMLRVSCWRGPVGLKLAVLFQTLFHYLSTSASNVLFILSKPFSLLFIPTLLQCPTHHRSMQSSLSSSRTSIIHQRLFFFLVICHSPTTVVFGGSQRRRPHPISPLTEVETDQQRSRAPPETFHDRA